MTVSTELLLSPSPPRIVGGGGDVHRPKDVKEWPMRTQVQSHWLGGCTGNIWIQVRSEQRRNGWQTHSERTVAFPRD